MPRNVPPVPSTLRNRNRITNKTRLKVIIGNNDAEPIIPDEDEEKHRIQQSVAGVDHDDANEHHLQQVLSEAASRNVSTRSIRGASEQKETPSAYIPTPDSTGVIGNYEELYPSKAWKDPKGFVFSSATVEESVDRGLAKGFTYTMDERDQEWLDGNNQVARGEGTSAQGAIMSPTGTRTSARNAAKGKGKDTDCGMPVVISEDDFELVMGLFELMTHEKTEFLHHSLKTGMAFPPYSDYREVFARGATQSMFASCTIPAGIPDAVQLSNLSKVVYSHWRERRVDRDGHRIIPTLNFDESDTLNESYVCFRRRDVKAARKTRATQITSSDRLLKLKHELELPYQMALLVKNREEVKQKNLQMAQDIWNKRLELIDIRSKHPSMANNRIDDELLIDKERPRKESRGDHAGQQQSNGGVSMRPKERQSLLQYHIDRFLDMQKERDRSWDDYLDYSYQPLPPPPPSRLFKYISSTEPDSLSPKSSKDDEQETRAPRPLRLRCGRGGRLLMDRCLTSDSSSFRPRKRPRVEEGEESQDAKDVAERLAQRWRFDSDDGPPYGPSGPDEQDRTLVDDFDAKYLRLSMTLLVDADLAHLMTDPTIPVKAPDGTEHRYPAYDRLGPTFLARPMQRTARVFSGGIQQHHMMPVPIAQQGMRAGIQHMRISQIPAGNRLQPPIFGHISSNLTPHSSPPNTALQSSPPNSTGSVSRSPINVPQAESIKMEATSSTGAVNGSTSQQQTNGNATTPQVSPPQGQQHRPGLPVAPLAGVNGYHVPTTLNSQPNQYVPQSSVLSAQQMQNLKSVFASPAAQAGGTNVPQQLPASYLQTLANSSNLNLQLGVGANMNLRLPTTRQQQLQWAQRAGTLINGGATPLVNGVNGVNGHGGPSSSPPAHTPSPAPTLSQPPSRRPSASPSSNANGTLPNGH